MTSLNPLVALLEHLAEATWDRMYWAEILDCPNSETTLTDNNLIELMKANLPGMRIYKARGDDEPKKGFDWEWYIRRPNGRVERYSVQAKKLDLRRNRYTTFRHRVRNRFQLDILEDFARRQRTIPLVCFHNAAPPAVEQQHWHCPQQFAPKQLGCSLAPLAAVRNLHRPRRTRSFETAHTDQRVLPWRCILCPNIPWSTGQHLFAPEDYEPRTLPRLPAFLEQPASEGPIQLPDDLYTSELGGKPRWIIVLEQEG